MSFAFATEALLAAIASLIGINTAFWGLVGLCRWLSEQRSPRNEAPLIKPSEVAVIIPAHNEEVALPKCVAALTRILPAEQIFVASDGSRDRTVDIALSLGCNAADIRPNGGKARAIARVLEDFELYDRFKVILIQDADSEIDPDYLKHGLPLFNDLSTAAVAGHVLSRWRPHRLPRWDMLFAAYRTRLYRLLQAVFQYGQSWKWANVSYIAPGFASMYRTSALRQIDITRSGLVIEDFNMTFEVHARGIGRVAYTPRARCSSEDPLTLSDYRKQVQRWNLGFWQTLFRHPVLPRRFAISITTLVIEFVGIALLTVLLPLFLLANLVFGTEVASVSIVNWSVGAISPFEVLFLYLAADYALTIVVAALERRPLLLIYGLAFPLIRFLDAALFVWAFFLSRTTRSDGRWRSPQRYGAADAVTTGNARLLA